MMHFRKNILVGCIAGDVLGAAYVPQFPEEKVTVVIRENSTFTDETLFAVAVADAMLTESSIRNRLCNYFSTYASTKFNSPLLDFLIGGYSYTLNIYSKPVLSRFVPVSYVAKNFKDLKEVSRTVLDATKNDGGSISAARFITTALYLCTCGYRKNDIKEILDKEIPEYRHTQTLEKLIKRFKNPLHAQFIAPLAFQAFMESDSYEHAILNALEIGINPEAMASLSGAFAMAYYQEIPRDIIEFTLMRLPMPFVDIMLQFQERFVLK